MTADELYDQWAPAAAVWSPWVKPVLFSAMPAAVLRSPPAAPEPWRPTWLPTAGDRVVMILDLPGAEGTWAALSLARAGWRPVPLYNAHPGPGNAPIEEGALPAVVVDVTPIFAALAAGGDVLWAAQLPLDAPPVFVLDANRRGPAVVNPGQFDNRSVSFATDFPSANLLLSHGYRRAVVIQQTVAPPQADLVHTLARWQAAGIVIEIAGVDPASPSRVHRVAAPSRLALLWHGFLARIGLRRHPLGGWGGVVPLPAAG